MIVIISFKLFAAIYKNHHKGPKISQNIKKSLLQLALNIFVSPWNTPLPKLKTAGFRALSDPSLNTSDLVWSKAPFQLINFFFVFILMCKLDGLALAAFLHPQAACLRPLGNNQKGRRHWIVESWLHDALNPIVSNVFFTSSTDWKKKKKNSKYHLYFLEKGKIYTHSHNQCIM